MLNYIPYDIFLMILINIYNLEHKNLGHLQRLMIINKELYNNNYDTIKHMLGMIIPRKIIIKHEQPFYKKSDWWIKLLHFNILQICNCKTSQPEYNCCKKCYRIKHIIN